MTPRPLILNAPAMTDAQRAAMSAANEADRIWFDQHPDRAHRARRPVFGEVPVLPDLIALVLIRQVRRGVRLRWVLYAATWPPGEPDEDAAGALWQQAMTNDPEQARLFACAEAEVLEVYGDG